MRIIAIEEHYILAKQREHLDASWLPDKHRRQIDATIDQRLSDMDACGIDLQVLSVPAAQPSALPAEIVVPMYQDFNNDLHSVVMGHPDRFAAFAALPASEPDDAAAELERAVTDLGFVGAMISGTVVGRFLDHPDYVPIWETAARLDVPIYLHPGPAPMPVMDSYYSGFRKPVNLMLANGGYGWHYETSLHAVRLIVAGVLDRWPNLKLILGHLGEGLPFHLSRLDEVLTPLTDRPDKPISSYVRSNFWFTTSGYFHNGPFELARQAIGDDRLIFSVDYPFADNRQACDWFTQLDLEPETRRQIAHQTAEKLLGLR
ncbi:amidohydrolase family protein [Streptomyces sp. NPDC013178]|uniref:amidohydrolase family protein n=1 Tax=Streptomyces sp. NPDC013178 TaxID=3155118 RepID=UPI0033E31A54